MSQSLPPGNRRMLPAARVAPTARYGYEREEEEPTLAPLDLRQLLATLRRRVWLIVAITVIAGAVATYFALTADPVYEAVATIRLTDSRRQLTGGLVDNTSGTPLQIDDRVTSEIAVLTSRAMARRVVDSMPALRLTVSGFPRRLVEGASLVERAADSVPPFKVALTFAPHEVTGAVPGVGSASAPYGVPLVIGGLRFAIWSAPRAKHGAISLTRREDAAERLARSLKAKARNGTNVIDVSYRSTDPVLAQQVVNTLIAVYQASNIQDAAQQARLRRQFVESQLRQNDSLLESARFALSSFRSRQQSYSTQQKFEHQATDVMQLQSQIQDIDLQRRMYSTVLQELRQGRARETLQALGAALSAQGASASPIVGEQYQQLVRLQGVRDSLISAGRATTNPDVQRVEQLMGTARDRLATTVAGILTMLDGRRTALESQKTQSTQQLSGIPAADADEAQLLEREQAYQKIADQLREELQKARLAEAAEVGSVEVVDTAPRPRVPISVEASRKILFGILLGLFFGGGCALVIEHLDTSLRGRDDLEASLQLAGLAVIPKIDGAELGTRVRQALGSGGNGHRNGSRNGHSRSKALVTVNDARSVGAEAYRTLRTKILFSRALSNLKTIVVTSPFAQDGKSTVAANLATTFAQHGMRTLLIDCDLRKPTQHEIFQVPYRPGLTELLTSDELVAGTGRRTAVEGLSLITAGTLPPDPPELVGSARMRALLDQLAEAFDVVVLDTPPVLPVADSAILASLVDGVILVVRAGQTDRRAAQLAVQQLQDVDARILGAVLNDPNERVPVYDRYGYASYYGYGHAGR